MKFVLLALAAFTALGCSSRNIPRSPTASSPPQTTTPTQPVPFTERPASIWAMVIDKDGGGVCLEGATLEIIRGKGAGEILHPEMPCDVWDFGGFEVKDLPPGEEFTFRVAAAGYTPKIITLFPRGYPSMAMIIELLKTR